MLRSTFENRDFTSVNDLQSPAEIHELFKVARILGILTETPQKPSYPDQKNVPLETSSVLTGYAVLTLFYEASTRTFTSFMAAINKLGASAQSLGLNEMNAFSSATKGENLRDTIRSLQATYNPNLFILRHPEDNSSQEAAEYSSVPVINAGSGKKEHPTQALLDLYTIQKELGRLDNIHIAMVGDMLYGRTIKSLAKLMATMGKNIEITFVSPSELAAPQDFLEEIEDRVTINQTNNIEDALHADVFYWTRVQRERLPKELDYEELKRQYILTPELASRMRPDAIFMHPLPRDGEISDKVDSDPRAVYLREDGQMRSGLRVRMGLIERTLNPLYMTENLPQSELKKAYQATRKLWYEKTSHISSPIQRMQHEAFQALINLGPWVAPLILGDLEKSIEQHAALIMALPLVTNGSPEITEEMGGNMYAIAQAWVDWGRTTRVTP